jgi:hypothetical protein
MADRSADRNFILQQGLIAPPPAACPLVTSALLFQPRAVGAWIAIGVMLRSPLTFAALGIVLAWSAALPRWNPFDAVHNRVAAARGSTLRLEPAMPPRRSAQALAAVFAAAIATALLGASTAVAIVLQAVLVLAVLALVVRRFCIGSFLYHLLRGDARFTPRTLPSVGSA